MTVKRWLNRIRGKDQPFALEDGRVLYSRLLMPADLDLLLQFRHLLSPESLRRRFRAEAASASDELVQRVAAGLVDVDNATSGAVLALYRDEAGEHIVGVARFARPAGDPTSQEAEIAFVVADPYQQQGVGHYLLQRLISLARDVGIHTLIANIETDNRPALKLVRRVGLPFESKTRGSETMVRLQVM